MSIGGIRKTGAELLRRVAERLYPATSEGDMRGNAPYSADGWDHIPQGQYDYVPKGMYVYGPVDRFLLVPKNRYRAVLLPDQTRSADLGVGWLTEDNSAEGYDLLWGDSSNLAAFKAEAGHARDKLTTEIVDLIEVHLPNSGSVCDVGCGVGDLLREVRRRRPALAVSGLDFSGKAVEGAARAMPDGAFQQFVIHQNLPYETASFDLVLCTDVLEHLEYPKRVAAELVRICRPGGTVAIVVPDGTGDQFLGHNWFWSKESFADMLAEFGARVSTLPVTKELMAVISRPHETGTQ
ncbi:2-polyprenyl-3-methyl-5-hydroxy-6-metoxy-1,4-benzoquinol methylase [Rhizobium pisi]|uniref:2-polyprenyl-3-methyl-5-hydroxy-6-metoxy-1, 4-benzoquinol methylase n=2 Tax=Rhizobium TaxID=379 RepID=A0A7W6BE38_9HYPH|nr:MULTISPECIES: class I SAM-dependent methyltransferase [Rhizobium]MBB3133605.1 2-polyprenyl-3-methyl-5-hydroxy-6-metoxy-1,4-benzoquinol methylase [Rhizobium pisi]MBB3918898.1 2-polyprenyl-3-methyl-5-hydroxy-6-metoxy-1,4-benzoquinol methylase [Rhizobium fabae]